MQIKVKIILIVFLVMGFISPVNAFEVDSFIEKLENGLKKENKDCKVQELNTGEYKIDCDEYNPKLKIETANNQVTTVGITYDFLIKDTLDLILNKLFSTVLILKKESNDAKQIELDVAKSIEDNIYLNSIGLEESKVDDYMGVEIKINVNQFKIAKLDIEKQEDSVEVVLSNHKPDYYLVLMGIYNIKKKQCKDLPYGNDIYNYKLLKKDAQGNFSYKFEDKFKGFDFIDGVCLDLRRLDIKCTKSESQSYCAPAEVKIENNHPEECHYEFTSPTIITKVFSKPKIINPDTGTIIGIGGLALIGGLIYYRYRKQKRLKQI